MTRPEIKINGQFPDGLRITIEKLDVLVDDNKQVSVFLDLFDDFMLQINEKITKPAQEEIAQMLRDAQAGKGPKLEIHTHPTKVIKNEKK